MNESERRRIAARMLAVASGGLTPEEGSPEPYRHRRRQNSGKAEPCRGPARPIRRHGARQARRLERPLLDLLEKLGSPTAFCAAAAVWGIAVALTLGCLGAVGG